MRFPEILTHPENFLFKSGFPDIRKFPAKWKHCLYHFRVLIYFEIFSKSS